MTQEARLWGWLDPDHADPIAGKPAVEAWLAGKLGLGVLTPTPPLPFEAQRARKSKLTPKMRRALDGAVGADKVSDDLLARTIRSSGQSYPDQLERRVGKIAVVADAVAFPETAEEVVALLGAAERNRFRVTPRGGGTSVVGGFDVAREGPPWVIADLSRMDRDPDAVEDRPHGHGAGGHCAYGTGSSTCPGLADHRPLSAEF